jgi:hypothetical protein
MHRVTQRAQLIPTSVYRKELAKARLGDNVANHMGYIFTAILYDKFDMTFKQVTNFYSKTVERRMAWQDDDNEEVTNESMMQYCAKKKIDVVKWVKSIPMPQKLYMADIQKGRAVLGADRNIESALASTMYLTIPTLKESYRFSNAKIEEFMKWVAYYIDFYWRKQPKSKEHYLSDAIIRQTFIEDEHWDIVTGKKVG